MDDNAAIKVAELIARGLEKRIDTLEENLNERMDRFDGQLGEVIKQTTKTNGRVTRLEAWREGLATGVATRTAAFRFRISTLVATGATVAAAAEAARLVFG